MPAMPAMPAKPAGGTLVRDEGALYGVVKRLHNHNDAVTFWNEQRTFKLMLRNDPSEDDAASCELLVLWDEDDERMQRVVELISDGYVDEAGVYVLDSWQFPHADFQANDVRKMMHAINDAYLYRICPCGEYMIKDDAAVCVFCQMTSTPQGRHKHWCSICCEDGMAMHMRQQPCCQQYLHAGCMATWVAKSGDGRCPLCRHPAPPGAQ